MSTKLEFETDKRSHLILVAFAFPKSTVSTKLSLDLGRTIRAGKLVLSGQDAHGSLWETDEPSAAHAFPSCESFEVSLHSKRKSPAGPLFEVVHRASVTRNSYFLRSWTSTVERVWMAVSWAVLPETDAAIIELAHELIRVVDKHGLVHATVELRHRDRGTNHLFNRGTMPWDEAVLTSEMSRHSVDLASEVPLVGWALYLNAEMSQKTGMNRLAPRIQKHIDVNLEEATFPSASLLPSGATGFVFDRFPTWWLAGKGISSGHPYDGVEIAATVRRRLRRHGALM